ncbi:hypothetical protein [Psychroserpens mesophilus]|uniref:hypothetical protein n=1 Tax=Psychroserpens mesophilus TaxID=325473 RepID=UPI003D6578A3
MRLDLIRIIIDFGLVVLIWMIQIIVYPSFKYYSNNGLIKWHKKYTFRLALIVIPLMCFQLFIYAFQTLKLHNAYPILGLTIVVLIWFYTFWQFVPLHNKIQSDTHSVETLSDLTRKNWFRTLLWTILFILSVLEFAT